MKWMAPTSSLPRARRYFPIACRRIPSSNMSIRLTFNLTSNWPSSTHLPIACSRRIKGQVFPPINLFSPALPLPPQTANSLPRKIQQRLFTGCIAPPDRESPFDRSQRQRGLLQYPCFEHPTLTDLLNKKFVSWRYYAPSAGSIWTAPNAIQHMCGPNVAPPNGTACVGADWTDNVVLASPQNPAPVLTDIAHGRLAERELGHTQRPRIRPRHAKRRIRTIMGCIHCERHWKQPLLVKYGHHYYLGRLGRMVRPRAAAEDAQFL